jgi:hypothetical protein
MENLLPVLIAHGAADVVFFGLLLACIWFPDRAPRTPSMVKGLCIMSEEELENLTDEICAPVREMVERYDPDGCEKWRAAVRAKLALVLG